MDHHADKTMKCTEALRSLIVELRATHAPPFVESFLVEHSEAINTVLVALMDGAEPVQGTIQPRRPTS